MLIFEREFDQIETVMPKIKLEQIKEVKEKDNSDEDSSSEAESEEEDKLKKYFI